MATNGSTQTNGHNVDYSVESLINEFLCSQLALKGYNWTPIVENGVNNDSHNNQSLNLSQRTRIVESLKDLGQQYVNTYEQQLAQMCERLEVSPSTAFATFNSVSNELFIEGIKWSHVITYLVFGSQFAFNCVQKGFPDLVNEVSHWMTSYVTQHLTNWINEHGGWEYVIEFAGETVVRPEGDGQWKLICGAAGAVGVLTLGLFLTNFNFFK